MALKSMLSARGFPYRGMMRVALIIGLSAFVLPFATVSCGSQDVLTGTGLNAIAGGHYTATTQSQPYSGDLSFLLAALGGIVALVCQFLRVPVRTRAVVAGAASLWSVVMLLVGQAHFNAEIADSRTSIVAVRWDAGFWIAIVAFGASAVLAALQLFGPSRSLTAVSEATALPGGSGFPRFLAAGAVPRSLVAMWGGGAALVGSAMIIVACALPYIRYTNTSIQPSSASVFNPGYAASNWFAAEPIGVALLAIAAGVVLVVWMSLIPRAIAAAMVLAFGTQTFLLFLGYVGLAIKSDAAQVGFGGVVGMLAGVVLFAGGLAAAFTLFARDPEPAAGEMPAAGTT